tara:strand:- start:6022 stop:8151 length:2130 start_codon:yes stop_codon:yes gene_type:complete
VISASLALGRLTPALAQLSQADRQIYTLAFKAADQNKLTLASALAIPAKDRLLAKVLLWQRLTRPESDFPFAQYRDFLADNPLWPGQQALAREAERALPDNLPAGQKLAWFDARHPRSGRGALLYLAALLQADRGPEAKEKIKDSWRRIALSKSQEDEFLARYGAQLTRADHAARLERLIRSKQSTAALRQARRLGAAEVTLTDARLKLRRRAAGVDRAIAKVPAQRRNDPGLIYARIEWRLGKNKLTDALALLDPPATEIRDPAYWWGLRKRAGRMALNAKAPQAAYRLVSAHGLNAGIGFAEGEFLAGWLALRHLDQPALALSHFTRLYDGVASPISRSRGAYWAGEAALSLGKQPLAARWFAQSAQYQQTFYGQLAANRLTTAPMTILPGPPRISPSQEAAFQQQEMVQILNRLAQIGADGAMKPFFSMLRSRAENGVDFTLIAQLARKLNRPNEAIYTAKRAAFLGIRLPESLHPAPSPLIAALNAAQRPESALVLSLIRQESAFDSAAISHAGARGLMQIMPATAKQVARREKLTYSKAALTTDDAYNLSLGQSYLARLLDDYQGYLPLALAAYNAGPGRAKAWISQYGDPRDPKVDPIDWIESIPFSETRNYVQRIMESLAVYNARLDLPSPSLASRLGYAPQWEKQVTLARLAPQADGAPPARDQASHPGPNHPGPDHSTPDHPLQTAQGSPHHPPTPHDKH